MEEAMHVVGDSGYVGNLYTSFSILLQTQTALKKVKSFKKIKSKNTDETVLNLRCSDKIFQFYNGAKLTCT